jgi:voltage-gated potassium channel Kch
MAVEQQKITARQRLRYRLDNAFSAGTSVLVAYLALATVLLIVVAGTIIAIAGIDTGGNKGFVEGAWAALMRTLDSGTMGGDAGWGFRAVALVVTLGGIFIVSSLIGLLATGINQKLEDLRKGRSLVVEEGHTLILGWSPKIIAIISELMIANENQTDAAIVVMASEDKVWMEDQVRSKIARSKTTRVVFRTGDPSDPRDLAIVNPFASKAIIILSREEESADAEVIRTVLALMQTDPDLQRIKVVAELTDERNATALGMATRGRVATVVSTDIIAKITAQVCRQSGLSAVYQELLDFSGDEFYFADEPRLAGMTFADAVLSFEAASIVGVKFAGGRIELNPPMDTRLELGDRVIAIAEDDDKVIFSGAPQIPADGLDQTESHELSVTEHLLVVGWNHLGPRLLQQLDQYVAADSTVHVIYDRDLVAEKDLDFEGLTKLSVSLEVADTSQHEPLQNLFAEREFDHVVVLCYRSGVGVAEADARTLMTLLQLRQLVAEPAQGEARVSIVTELLDVKDVELAKVANPDDFVVSEQLVSLLLAQLAENPDLGSVFADLFDSYESEIMLKPAGGYVQTGDTVRFEDAVASARRFHEVAIGYRKESGEDGGTGPVIVVNPKKSHEMSFDEADQIIVLTTA